MQEVQPGWKVARWGSVEKKEDSHFFGLRGSLQKLDHVSRTVREDWTTVVIVDTWLEYNL